MTPTLGRRVTLLDGAAHLMCTVLLVRARILCAGVSMRLPYQGCAKRASENVGAEYELLLSDVAPATAME
jgi:hypothetical protein